MAKRVVRPAQNWEYFTLEPLPQKDYGFYIVDEDGERLTEDGWRVIVDSQLEAEEYLIKHNIRGSVR
jgi:hypothetical protein